MVDKEYDFKEVDNLLKQWKLSSYQQTFRDNYIDSEVFLSLDSDSIRELIPQVGPRIIFNAHYKKYKKLKETEDAEKQRDRGNATFSKIDQTKPADIVTALLNAEKQKNLSNNFSKINQAEPADMVSALLNAEKQKNLSNTFSKINQAEPADMVSMILNVEKQENLCNTSFSNIDQAEAADSVSELESPAKIVISGFRYVDYPEQAFDDNHEQIDINDKNYPTINSILEKQEAGQCLTDVERALVARRCEGELILKNYQPSKQLRRKRKSDDGEVLEKDYDGLDEYHRNMLCDILVKEDLASNPDTRSYTVRCAVLSDQIQQLLPNETKDIYYKPFSSVKINGKLLSRQAAKGKLYHRFNNYMKALKTSGVR